jgi:hypothetical protein
MRLQRSSTAYSSYNYLITMLTEGWNIEPPVYVRPRWQSRATSRTPLHRRAQKENTYHFVLRYGDRFSLISVFDCPEVQQLLEDRELSIDHL